MLCESILGHLILEMGFSLTLFLRVVLPLIFKASSEVKHNNKNFQIYRMRNADIRHISFLSLKMALTKTSQDTITICSALFRCPLTIMASSKEMNEKDGQYHLKLSTGCIQYEILTLEPDKIFLPDDHKQEIGHETVLIVK